jgi:hypothetical protein
MVFYMKVHPETVSQPILPPEGMSLPLRTGADVYGARRAAISGFEK